MPLFAYKIVVGWNDVASLVNLEGIDPSPTLYLNAKVNGLDADTSYFVTSTPILENFASTTGGKVQSGKSRQEWIFQLIQDDALKYFIDTYCNKKVTIATKVDNVYDTYTNWNAYLDKPQLSREQRFFDCDVWWFENVIIPVTLYSVAS